MPLLLRQAQAKDLPEMNQLIHSGFVYWEYVPERIDKIMALIKLEACRLDQYPMYLAYHESELIGFFGFSKCKDGPKVDELQYFFIDKKHIGNGYGKQIWGLCCTMAKSHGISEFFIKSVIEAEGFYLKMGAKRIGQVASQVTPGLFLPILSYSL
ncbi:MAG: hydroxyurea phosphotransferase [Gammaproteobacteria bacterium]|jgi:N-acetylglutamate synthase-like GNAT family acetyltransferase|nr:hydroxyurea phosphotransferase [Gammaproteobacteria bacterium]